MPTDLHLVNTLRSLFEEGATPSRLIRYIVSRHPDDPDWHHLVQECFRNAFRVPVVRILNERESWEEVNRAHWDLNVHLLHRMVEQRPTWHPNPATDQQSWLDSLTATDEPELIAQCQPPPELAESWDDLPPRVQEYIRRITGNARALHERVLILARLAERLQQLVEGEPRSEVKASPD